MYGISFTLTQCFSCHNNYCGTLKNIFFPYFKECVIFNIFIKLLMLYQK